MGTKVSAMTDSGSLDRTEYLRAIRGSSDIKLATNRIREVITADRAYYVRADGSDSNTGLANTAGGAFLTIQKAFNVIGQLDWGINRLTLDIGAGTFAGAALVGPCGGGQQPDNVGSKSLTINTAGTIAAVGSGNATIIDCSLNPVNRSQGLSFYGPLGTKIGINGGISFQPSNGDFANYICLFDNVIMGCDADIEAMGDATFPSDIIFDTNYFSALSVTGDVIVNGAGVSVKGVVQVFFVDATSSVSFGTTFTFVNTPNIETFIVLNNHSYASIGSCTFTGSLQAGCVKFICNSGSTISIFNSDLSYLPGSVAGSLVNGAAYGGIIGLQAPGVVIHGPVAFASLPSSPTEGMVASVNNSNTSTWGATIAGGGANKVLAYYNGTNWTVAGK